MKIINARNANQAIPVGLHHLRDYGLRRDSRNGPVLVAPGPVTTVYEKPLERVVFWQQRDANPFFHLYEALWMLAGRNDLAPLLCYVSTFDRFSDDGKVLRGAYGERWRKGFGFDQLPVIIDRLTKDPTDRRSVLAMWDGEYDLGADSKDVPCNLLVSFQRTPNALDMTVFCRSNDIVWGAYGANAVHFGFLQEYIAAGIGCPVGVYHQVSVNWHGYLSTVEPLLPLVDEVFSAPHSVPNRIADPYADGEVYALPLAEPGTSVEEMDDYIDRLLAVADADFPDSHTEFEPATPFTDMVLSVLAAHHAYRTLKGAERYTEALRILAIQDPRIDWVRAGREWIERRYVKWQKKEQNDAVAQA